MHDDYPRTESELEQRFYDEAACLEYLHGLRWPEAFCCPGCGHHGAWPMRRGLWLCQHCRRQTSVLARTVFQDTKLPLATWFAAMWQLTSQSHGVSAMDLQRVLKLGSYRTAWCILHKLRRTMGRPGSNRLTGRVEAAEVGWDGVKTDGPTGRLTPRKLIIAVVAQPQGQGIGQIRLRCLSEMPRRTLRGFIVQMVEPGSTVLTDGSITGRDLPGYGCVRPSRPSKRKHGLPQVHQVMLLLNRWLLASQHVSHYHLGDYLNEFAFRFNHRKSAARGELFYRLVQQAVQAEPAPYFSLRLKPRPR